MDQVSGPNHPEKRRNMKNWITAVTCREYEDKIAWMKKQMALKCAGQDRRLGSSWHFSDTLA